MLQVNPNLVGALEEAGLKFVGRDVTGERMEVNSLLFWLLNAEFPMRCALQSDAFLLLQFGFVKL